MPPISGKQRKAQLKLNRAIKRGDSTPALSEQPRHRGKNTTKTPAAQQASRNARGLQSQFVRLDKTFLDLTKALAGSIVLSRPIQSDVAVLRRDWINPGTQLAQLTLPRRPKWRYEMSKEELDANEQAYFRAWLAEQDASVEQWQRALNVPPADQTDPPADLSGDHPRDSEAHMPYPPTHFERNIEVWRQFWRVTEISQILLVLLDSRCPPLHLPSSLSTYLNIPTLTPPQSDTSPRSKRFSNCKAHVILVLTKIDISGPARTTSWTSFLKHNYPGIPIVPVEAYAPKSSLGGQGPTRYEPHLPGSFRERLVRTLQDVHQQLLQPPQWLTAPRAGESEQERLQRIDRWRPRVRRVVDWDRVLEAKGKLVGKAVGGAALPKGQDLQNESDNAAASKGDGVNISDSEAEQLCDAYEWKEPEFLTIGVIGQPNVGKSSLLNAIFGTTRVRASRTPGKTKHFQTLFWTADVRLVDCPGLVMPSFVPMDVQVLSGVLPISRISAVPFCVHQLSRLLPLERILELTHPLSSTSESTTVVSSSDRDPLSHPNRSSSKAKSTSKSAPAANAASIQDKRTWGPGQRPLERPKAQSNAPRWTATDIMTAYAERKGWVTAKAGRPDVHRAGNAILRLVAEGRIPWAFWPPDNSASGDDGIWLRDGVQQHAWDEPETDKDDEENSEDQVSEVDEVSNDEEDVGVRTTIASGGSDEDEDKPFFCQGNLGRFGALRIDD